MRRILSILIKLAVSAGLLAYLFTEAQRSDPATFTRLRHTSLNWPLLLLGWSCLITSMIGGMLRWRVVLRALGVSSPIGRLLRYALYGYALDFVALGTAGGDLVKAMLLARGQSGRRALVLASVLIDRVIGLYSLLTLSALVVLASDALGAELYVLRTGLLSAVLGMNLVLGLLWLAPGLSKAIERRGREYGRYGKAVADVVVVLRGVRERPHAIAAAVLINLAALALLVMGFFLVGLSFPGAMPTLAEQWQIVPIVMLSDIIPLPGGTLGALDYAMSFLYQHVTSGRVALGQGLLVTMTARLASVALVTTAATLYAMGGVSDPRADA